MSGCKVIGREETHSEKCERQWNMAKKVYAKLVNGNFNRVQIELYENILMKVDAIGTITYGYGVKQ